jgi:carbon storage regulator
VVAYPRVCSHVFFFAVHDSAVISAGYEMLGKAGSHTASGHENGGCHMLVLTRKNGESVVVGDNNGVQHLLKVTVIDIRGQKVRLGFEIDSSVPVHRWEVWERIHAAGLPDHPVNGPAVPIA